MEQTKQNEQPSKSAEELEAEKKKAAEDASLAKQNIFTIKKCIERTYEKMRKEQLQSQNLANKDVFNAHVNALLWVANNVVLAHQRRKFVVDDNNRDVLRFLLYYFNGCPLAEDVFPGRGYKLHKHIMLKGLS